MKPRKPLTEKRIREIIQEELAKLPSGQSQPFPVPPQTPGGVYAYAGPFPFDSFPPAVAYYACSFVPDGGAPPPTSTITWTSTRSINVGKKP